MKIHLDIRIRYLQFRILHRYLGTNHQVSKFRNDIPDKCTFCEKKNGNTAQTETIQHLFFQCEVSNGIITQYYQKHLNEEIEHLNEENFIFTPIDSKHEFDTVIFETGS